MIKGTIVVDVDGTITRRDCALGDGRARLFRQLLREGWQLFVVTGRSLDNIEPRVLDPIRGVSPGPFDLGLFTCEGARRWTYTERGAALVAAPEVFTKQSKEEIAARVNDALGRITETNGATVVEVPSWWEDSLLAFKVQPAAMDRREIIRQVQERVLSDGDQLRIGAAGRSTVVITRAEIHKGTALREIRSESPVALPVLYLADEFEPPGNDAVALKVPGILCVSVGGPTHHGRLFADLGHGPAGAYRFLKSLLRLSCDSVASSQDLVAAAVRECVSFR
jgi:hypothetical protein